MKKKKKRPTWQVSLHAYNLNKSKVLHPRIIIRGTLTLDDIAKETQRRMSGHYDEAYIRAVASTLMDVAEDALIDGYAVSTPLGTLRPTVTGMWNPERIQPEARHQNTAIVTYSMSKRLKETLENPLFEERMRRTVSGPQITATSDMGNHLSPDTITPGSLLMVKGRQLLMNGDSPQRGVEFVDTTTQEAVRFVAASELQMNTRSGFIVPVPTDLPEGEYHLAVTSQCCTKPTPLLHPVRWVSERGWIAANRT